MSTFTLSQQRVEEAARRVAEKFSEAHGCGKILNQEERRKIMNIVLHSFGCETRACLAHHRKLLGIELNKRKDHKLQLAS